MPFISSKARAAFFAKQKGKTQPEALKPPVSPKLPDISKTEMSVDSKELDEYLKPLSNPLDKFKKLKNILKPKY